jgi:hypothetical protein
MNEDQDPEIAELRVQLTEAEGRAQTAVGEAARLTAELAAATDAASAFETDIASLRGLLDDAAQREREAASRYRDLVVRSDPSLPPDLITGDTVDAVEASLAAAREIAGRVRSHIEAQAQAVRVPAGAPQRAGPDLSAMTPDEKIKYGLTQRVQT